MQDRRSFLCSTAAVLALAALSGPIRAAGSAGLRFGRPSPFSFDDLVAEAGRLAAGPYAPPPSLPRAAIERIDYEAHGKIHFDTDFALFRDGPGQFPVTFFHLGRFFPTPGRMYRLEDGPGGTAAREIVYEPGYFTMPADSPARQLPAGAGFAGFRCQESRLGDQHELPWQKNDWVAFLGASYFRAIGELHQYGLSARGIAIDVAQPGKAEEFPAFTRFYFEPPADRADSMTVYALLEGESIAGAYRFVMHRTKAVVMEVEAQLFLRRAVARLGLAPLTSMFWFSETEKPEGIDWRPEVHDSDGLALWTGTGERIWRPLNDPARTTASAFADRHPRGFGLMQRDRVFDHYLDGVNYDRRPSLWVEPLDDWGEGSVQLVEIPTDDEIHDNIVAYWVPKAAAAAGGRYHLRYRLHWTANAPFPSGMAICTATRLGRGGQPGQPRPKGVTKFMVEFQGGPLAKLPYGTLPEAMLSAPKGHFSYVFTEAVPDGIPGHWRAQFDYTPADADPVDMRLFLKLGDRTLSETWLYQFQPGRTV